MSDIHPTAVVDPGAELGRNVRIGPLCHVGAGVRLGDECVLQSHVALQGPAVIGPGNTFYPFCTIGAAPQDLKYKGGPTRVEIGSDNVFRENVTVHRGTEVDQRSGGATRIGDRNLLMVGTHVAHDAWIGNSVIIANNVQIAGHVHIEDCVNIGGASAMHHFVTIGRCAFVGGMTRIVADVPPFVKVSGLDGAVRALNTEGLRRWHYPEDSIAALKEAYKTLFLRRGENGGAAVTLSDALAAVEADGLIRDPHVRYLVEFLRRQMDEGRYGRAREAQRTDRPEDRAAFYRTNA